MTRRMLATLLPAALAGQAPLPPLEAGLVKDFVGKAHQRKLEPMRELLERDRNLIWASWDWGGGDFENAIQAAAHTGSGEMALFLLDRGARLDLPAAAMLGELDILKAASRLPGFQQTRGAHGIPLLSHAIAGAAKAQGVLDFLLGSGADVNARHDNGMTPLMMAVQTAQRETVRVLLAKGADPRVKAKSGQTALSLSVKFEQPEIAADLRRAGAVE